MVLNEGVSGFRVHIRGQCGHTVVYEYSEGGVIVPMNGRLYVDEITQEVVT